MPVFPFSVAMDTHVVYHKRCPYGNGAVDTLKKSVLVKEL